MAVIGKSASNPIDIQIKNISRDKATSNDKQLKFFKDKLQEKMDGSSINSKETQEKESISQEEGEKDTLSKKDEKLLSILEEIYKLLYERKHIDISKKLKPIIKGGNGEEIAKIADSKIYNLLENLSKVMEEQNDDFSRLKALLINNESALNLQGKDKEIIEKIALLDNSIEVFNEENLNANDLAKFISEKLKNAIEHKGLTQNKLNAIEVPKKNFDEILQKDKAYESIENTTVSKEEAFLKNLIGKEEKHSQGQNLDLQLNKLTNLDGLNKFTTIDKNLSVEVKENITITKANMIEDMVKSIKYMENKGLKDLTVKVMPKELGEIVIKLTMEAGKIKLALNASSKDTYYLLNSNIGELSEKLTDSNIKIQPAEINIYNQDTTFFSNEFSGNRNDAKENGNSYRKGFLVQDKSLSDDEEIINNYEIYKGNLNAKV